MLYERWGVRCMGRAPPRREHGEFKHALPATAGASGGTGKPLHCVCAFNRGFVVGGAGGVLSVFERGDDKEGFMLTHSFSCTQASGVPGASAATGGADVVPLDITSLSLTPSEEVLVCSCATSQLASFPLANIDILKFGLTRHDTEAFVELAKWPVSNFSGLGRVTAYGAACYGRAPS